MGSMFEICQRCSFDAQTGLIRARRTFTRCIYSEILRDMMLFSIQQRESVVSANRSKPLSSSAQ